MRQYVDVAGAYGINPFELTPSQLHYLYQGIPRTMAKREMWTRTGRSSLSEDRVYNLAMAIDEDEDKAQKQVAKFIINESKKATRR